MPVGRLFAALMLTLFTGTLEELLNNRGTHHQLTMLYLLLDGEKNMERSIGL